LFRYLFSFDVLLCTVGDGCSLSFLLMTMGGLEEFVDCMVIIFSGLDSTD
jgi:hypothetical protein